RVDRCAVGVHGEEKAGPDRCRLESNCAGAAHAVLAADVRSGQSQSVTEEVRQQQPWLDELAVAPTVDGHGDRVHVAAAHARATARSTRTSTRRRRYSGEPCRFGGASIDAATSAATLRAASASTACPTSELTSISSGRSLTEPTASR